ncbi:MAG: potassium-transporting ATPase subunit B, partial [Chlorobiaceae bacterium]|nr:potassium-transporting ATPase subunit B [Chlorobiaceae bacterium]
MMNSNSFSSAYDQAKSGRRQARNASIFEKKLVLNALSRSIMMLDPRAMAKNPVMFVTEAGAFLTTLIAVSNALTGAGHQFYTVAVMLILWLTVMFSNFAEALAEARGKAQTDTLKRTRQNTVARRVIHGREESVSSDDLQEGDQVIVLTGEIIPGDGEVVEGAAMVDESAITGESAPVVREAGGDRSGVVGGTRVISDHIIVRISVSAGHSFLDK